MNWFWSRTPRPQIDTCASLEPLLSLFSDGMASLSEARRVEAHLADCAECRRALEWTRVTRLVIAKRPIAIPPPDLRLRIAQAIAAESAASAPVRRAPRRPALRPAFAMAASLALVAAVGLSLDHALKPSPPPVVPVVTPPRRVADAPLTVPIVTPAAKTTPPKPFSRSASGRVAKTPLSVLPHPTAAPRNDGMHIARLPDAPAVPDAPAAAGPQAPVTSVVKSPPARVKVAPGRPLMARTVTPHVTPRPAPRGPVLVAKAPTEMPLHSETVAVLTPSAPSVAPTPVEVARPEPTHTEVAVLTPTPPTVREDVLSHVRASLAVFKTQPSIRIARNEAAHVQSASYDAGPSDDVAGASHKFVQLSAVYSPTILPHK